MYLVFSQFQELKNDLQKILGHNERVDKHGFNSTVQKFIIQSILLLTSSVFLVLISSNQASSPCIPQQLSEAWNKTHESQYKKCKLWLQFLVNYNVQVK